MRLVGNRNLLHGRRTALAEELNGILPHEAHRDRHGGEDGESYKLEFDFMTVALPQKARQALRMVVVKGFGKAAVSCGPRWPGRDVAQVPVAGRRGLSDAVARRRRDPLRQAELTSGHPGPDVPAPEKHGRSAAGRHLLRLRLAGRTAALRDPDDQHHPRRRRIYGVAGSSTTPVADGLGKLPSRAAGNGTATSRPEPRIKPARTGLSGMTRFFKKLLF